MKDESHTTEHLKDVLVATRILEATLVAAWAFTYFTARNLMERGLHQDPWGIYAVCAAALVLCLLFRNVRYDHLDDIFRRLTRATAVGVLIYMLVEPPDLTLANPDAAWLRDLLVWAWAPAAAAALLSLWRPVFLAVPALHILITRKVTQDISGFPISILDIHYLVDMSMLLAASAGAIWALGRLKNQPRLPQLSPVRLSQGCAFLAIGVHLGNYFWSGVAKLQIGPDWSYWIFENATQHAMLPSLAIGILPFSGHPAWVQAVYEAIANLQPGVNIALVALQIFAIAAVLRVSLLRFAVVAYDLMHVAIFLLLGAFFWPWIWNNVSILVALRGRTAADIGWVPKFLCIGVILSGMSYHYARSAQLAWFDVPVMKLTTIEARANNGDWVEVPSSFFLGHSYSMGHGVMGFGREQGHYPPGARGNTLDLGLHRTANTCPTPAPLESPETTTALDDRNYRIDAFLRAHHAKMQRRAEWLPPDWYYWRAHHFPSNPRYFRDFSDLRLADVAAYRVRTRSVCMSLKNGRLAVKTVAESARNVTIEAR